MANLNLNKVVLGGRLTADVELKQTPTGTPVSTFTIAVTRKANREKTDFINCIAWKNTAEFVSKYFRKGSSICIAGEIQTRSWEDQNTRQKRYATEVIVDEVYFVDSKSESATQPQSQSQSQSHPQSAPSYFEPPTADFEDISSEDELPF